MTMNRRSFSRITASLGLTALLGGAREALSKDVGGSSGVGAAAGAPQNIQEMEAQHEMAMQKYGSFMSATKLVVGIVAYPGMFLQDFVGPITVFEALMNREIHLLWKDLDSVKSVGAGGIAVTPTTTFKDCPKNLDVLLVPGGVPGMFPVMEDPEVMNFLIEQGKTAKYITSVCTGSFILGAAGLLNGYRATSYWSMVDILREFGATPVRSRVVIDRNRITAGGVTAGIDFALKIVAKLIGPEHAQAIQLYLEYDPAPPYNAGSPGKAPKRVKEFISDMSEGMNKMTDAIAVKLRKQYPGRFGR
jgi:cyclohexyl-isocyanide hydratase